MAMCKLLLQRISKSLMIWPVRWFNESCSSTQMGKSEKIVSLIDYRDRGQVSIHPALGDILDSLVLCRKLPLAIRLRLYREKPKYREGNLVCFPCALSNNLGGLLPSRGKRLL